MNDLGKERFAWLLRQRRLQHCDETKLAGHIPLRGKLPDFYVSSPGLSPFLVEVESFRDVGPYHASMSSRSRVMAVSPRLIQRNLTRIKGAVDRAAEQLKPYQDLGIPMVVVLDNARRVGISLSSTDLVQLLGVLEFRGMIDTATGDTVIPVRAHHGAGQVLTSKWKRYVSAVAVNMPKRGHQYIEPPETERPMRLRILHNPFALVPLPISVFDDPEDKHIGREAGRWVDLQTRGPITD